MFYCTRMLSHQASIVTLSSRVSCEISKFFSVRYSRQGENGSHVRVDELVHSALDVFEYMPCPYGVAAEYECGAGNPESLADATRFISCHEHASMRNRP